nr:MAG TPA: DNA N-6-adenine-methyltransferase [Caudoviricetes sp.]
MDILGEGHKLAMFLKLQFLEGKKRKQFYIKYPPVCVYVSSSRLHCGRNGVFDFKSNAVAYAWYVWQKGFSGSTVIRWVN